MASSNLLFGVGDENSNNDVLLNRLVTLPAVSSISRELRLRYLSETIYDDTDTLCASKYSFKTSKPEKLKSERSTRRQSSTINTSSFDPVDRKDAFCEELKKFDPEALCKLYAKKLLTIRKLEKEVAYQRQQNLYRLAKKGPVLTN